MNCSVSEYLQSNLKSVQKMEKKEFVNVQCTCTVHVYL